MYAPLCETVSCNKLTAKYILISFDHYSTFVYSISIWITPRRVNKFEFFTPGLGTGSFTSCQSILKDLIWKLLKTFWDVVLHLLQNFSYTHHQGKLLQTNSTDKYLTTRKVQKSSFLSFKLNKSLTIHISFHPPPLVCLLYSEWSTSDKKIKASLYLYFQSTAHVLASCVQYSR